MICIYMISASKKTCNMVHFSICVVLRDSFTTGKSNYKEGYKLLLESNSQQQHCHGYWAPQQGTDLISPGKTQIIITDDEWLWIMMIMNIQGILMGRDINNSFLSLCLQTQELSSASSQILLTPKIQTQVPSHPFFLLSKELLKKAFPSP